MGKHRLIPHPDSICTAVTGIEVDIVLSAPGGVDLRYVVTGRMDEIDFPSVIDRGLTYELWRHTCFEMFSRTVGAERYDELNLSPSSQWVSFGFASYRSDRGVLCSVPPDIVSRIEADRYELRAFGVLSERGPWRIGLSAVIEEKSGRKSYWALAHPPGAPDFHHEDCFALELPAAGTP